MSVLMRAPQPCASWFWDLDDVTEPGLEQALKTAGRMAGVLGRYGLLEPVALEWGWFAVGTGGLGIRTRFTLAGQSLDSVDLPGQLRACGPVGHPSAEMSDLLVVGSGTWVDAEGKEHRESRLVELTVSPDPIGPSAGLSVHHDVWAAFDFHGRPHPAVRENNAPRLANALGELERLLGVPGEGGEPTYFGVAEGYGLAVPDVIDGLGPDLTDLM
ncbi:hypothetical protein [Streptomyces sp. SID3212]|uniref:hypothetical protein n=1 Tax=Streptomyces sp. SID3212 TaxID=2690259 RepID=UPI001F41CBA1|nr:hypothetical protein [Streptomyces sp. SID3212]